MSVIDRFRRSGADAQTEITARRTELQELQHRRDRAVRAPRPAAEVHASIEAVVAAQARQWLATYGEGLWAAPQSLASVEVAGQPETVQLPGRRRVGDALDEFGAQCVADPAASAKFLAGIFSHVKYEAGPPSAGRAALVERLTAELNEKMAAEEALTDAMQAAGFAVEHREDVRQRRESARHARERDADAAARRAEREALLNAAHQRQISSRP